jgi:hypothetical protein
MRRGYDSAFSVSAAWSLEFAPVNVSVVMLQCDGNEHFCIGSRSWFFAELADCVAEVRTLFPWRVHTHVLPPEAASPKVWARIFEELQLYNAEHAPELPDNRRMLVAQQFMRRLHIDTMPRPWEPEGNNAQLVDSLNGYRVKELAGHTDVFTVNPLATHEQYLSRAVEHYAAWVWNYGIKEAWEPAPDWSAHDRMQPRAWAR